MEIGVFYYNPDNPSEYVDKRRGIGSTINFGSKMGRSIGALLFVPVIIVMIIFIVFGFFK